jgi:leader peptidase (prepilin peptidase)/N-methyltransferase
MANLKLSAVNLNFLYTHAFANYFFVFLFGLIFGSFATVLTVRVMVKKSIVRPGSGCPQCGYELKFYDNIPVISYLLLRGKCRQCKSEIGLIYPLIELATGMLFLIGFQVAHSGLEMLSLFIFATLTLPLTVIDLKTHRLPNTLTLSGMIAGLLFATLNSISADNFHLLLHGVTYGFLAALFFLIIHFVSRGGMGIGDAKLALTAGLLLYASSGDVIIFGLFAAFLIGALWGIGLMIFAGAERKTAIPFGPFILLGLWMAVLFQNFALFNYHFFRS